MEPTLIARPTEGVPFASAVMDMLVTPLLIANWNPALILHVEATPNVNLKADQLCADVQEVTLAILTAGAHPIPVLQILVVLELSAKTTEILPSANAHQDSKATRMCLAEKTLVPVTPVVSTPNAPKMVTRPNANVSEVSLEVHSPGVVVALIHAQSARLAEPMPNVATSTDDPFANACPDTRVIHTLLVSEATALPTPSVTLTRPARTTAVSTPAASPADPAPSAASRTTLPSASVPEDTPETPSLIVANSLVMKFAPLVVQTLTAMLERRTGLSVDANKITSETL